ncbi:MAG TPA: hypothetical protein VFZ40_09525 [Pyrinomonadaceae bacterium]
MTPTVTEGTHGQYLWLERSIEQRAVDRPMSRLTKHCPEVLLGKHVVVTSLDSGPLHLNDAQQNAGWKRDGRFAISPRIATAADVPFCLFDEWFIFDDGVPTTLDIEVFVNKGTFSLGDPNPTIDTMYVGSDAGVRAAMIAAVVPWREKFWTQLERLNAESYVANGNCFTFVTRDAKLHHDVTALMQSF